VTLCYDDAFGTDMSIVSDPGLKHIIFNVLDNAYEASPRWVRLSAARNGDRLVLKISDAGPGFTPEMLAQFGKPYRSNKGRLGGGLGLFLVVNVVRKLGGAVSASNRPGGGAVVTLDLPLSALAMGGHGHAG
jgi:two-component system sensor histidine kinase RegB